MKQKVSDTVSVTWDGRTLVDVNKLFAKPSFRKILEQANKIRLRGERKPCPGE